MKTRLRTPIVPLLHEAANRIITLGAWLFVALLFCCVEALVHLSELGPFGRRVDRAFLRDSDVARASRP